MKKILLSLLLALGLAGGAAAAGGSAHWDKFPEGKVNDLAALQNGAKLFVNYCLNCHSAGYMRYNRLRDIGLSEEQIKKNLMFATDKVGETMKVTLDPKQAKEWFGALPPDLTLIARSRAGAGGSGADYLYTYLRTYYRDDTKATGWNNLAFPSVGMPHVLWELQGQRVAKFVDEKDPHDPSKTVHRFAGFEQLTPGQLDPREYDEAVGDLVAFLQWMGEPAAGQRVRIGVWVLLFLAFFTVIAWRLNAAYWKDVK
ncbi:MAG: cytochrome c1 [Piscinibacter sp.]|uniref:cytochrome c1 n=1 Tax=Piscinibacter TaxID=1114981 RepID=UPI000FDD9100|nr:MULTISPECIES: cytochrome c1 [Piscinibacter]MCW5666006.1 cytochrome c1 [Piscinibacter sp.]